MRKPVFGASDQVQHKPDCVSTENGQRLEILDLGSTNKHGDSNSDALICFDTKFKSLVYN